LAVAVLVAFVFTQIGYLGHDLGHRQVFKHPRHNDLLMLSLSFIVGGSASWWISSHNLHHRSPNQIGVDPHTAIPGLAFSPDQLRSKSDALRWLTRFQAFYFFPLLLLQGFGMHMASAQFLMSDRARYVWVERTSLVVHAVVYLGLLLFVMVWWQALLFIIVHHCLMGFYMGSVFAPNHKGMLILEGKTEADFLTGQVLTTRNLKPHPVTDFVYGGLNYQIEHHLFPTLPRPNLRRAQPIVKQFCADRGLSYEEVGVWASFVIVARALADASRLPAAHHPEAIPQADVLPSA
jgi:fatty acid desaturase